MLPITRQKKMLGLHNEIFLHTNYIKGASESYALKLISSYKGNRKDLINSTDNDGKTLLHHFIEGYLSTLISIQLILSKKKDAKEILRKKTDEANFYLASVFGLNNIYSLQELGAFDAKDNQNNTPIGMVVNFIRAYDIANKFIYYGGKHRLIDKKHPRLGFSRVFRPHSDFEFSNNAIEQLLIYMGINVKSEYLIKLSELLPTQDIDNIPAELYEHLWKYKPNCSAEFVNMLRYEHVKNILEGNKETLSKLQALSFKEGHHSPVVEAIIHILKKKHIPALQSAAKKGFVEKQWFDLIEKEGRQLPSNITRKSMTETIEQADISGLIKLLNTDFTRIILENFDLELRVREGLNNFSDTDFDVLAEAILAQIKANEGKNELLRKLTKLDNKIKEGSQALFSYIEQYTTANENKDKLRKLLSDNKEIIGFLSIANHFIKQVTVRLKKTMPELLQEVNKYNLYQLIIAIYREDIFTIDRIYKNEAIDINSKLDNSAYGLALNLYRQKYSVSRDSRSYDTNKNIKNLTDKFDQKLLEACEIGTDIIKEFCQKASTNIVPLDPSQFMTPLFYAVIAGKISIAAMLARKYGASIKPVDDCLIIPQHFAAFVGEVKMLEALSKQYDTGFNIGDKELRTPLHFAALGYGRSLFAELEKFKTISIEELKKADGHGQTFFHYAAKSGELPMTTTILTKLISLGKADEIVNLTDNEGRTPFHYLVLSELPKKYEQEKVEEAIDLFISAGADINAKDNEGRTAADLAKEKGYEDINRLIHENITKQSAMAAITESLTKEFLAAVEGNKLQQAEEVLKKCENGKQREAVLNSKNDTGDTALYLACKNENEKLLKLLLSSGADPNITSEYNNTALHIAVQKNQEAMVEALLAHNINVDTKNILGYTALHYAAQLGRDKIASILVKHKADVNARALYGDRPLHYAAEKGHSNLVRILISLGAEPDGKNDFGQTALHYAAENGNVEIAIILLTANPKLILEKDVSSSSA